MNSICTSEFNALSISNPLDRIFAQYRAAKAEIEQVAEYIAAAGNIHYFFDAAKASNRYSYIGVSDVFRLEPAIKALDADYWQKAMQLTDVMEYMPAGKRSEWNMQIREHKTVPFEFESVKMTMVQLINSRAQFMAERVDGLFRALSGEHVTNRPQGFGKRFILNYMLSYGSINSARANYIHDLRCVIGKFIGREVPNSRITEIALDSMARDGQWNEFDGGAFKIRLYKKGTAHMEVHPDIAWQLNQVLAQLYPLAIPPEFRTKPKKQPKTHKLHDNLVSFEVMAELERGIPYQKKSTLDYSYKEPPSQPTIDVIGYLGGVSTEKNVWEFDYLLNPVLKELNRSGRIPEQKSHQYYPTPASLAEIAVAMAEIEPQHECLEPSAGQGGLADFMPKDRTLCVEVSPLHCKILEAKGHRVSRADFLLFDSGNKFDRIAMNPPFSDGRAVAHVKHAASMLARGGRLVAIMPASNKGKTIVEGMAHEWHGPCSNEFAGASVSVVILVLRREA